MEKILKRLTLLIIVCAVFLLGCGKEAKTDEWLASSMLDRLESPEELYQKALKEDILIVYTVTTRVAETKDYYEAAYPGLYVEIRDLRSPNLVEEVENNYKKGQSGCDVVICTDNSGDFKTRLVDTGIVVPYLPEDIKSHMKTDGGNGTVSLVNEAEMLFYNADIFDSCPIENIWELTEEKYRGRIFMPNPLRSFSTFSFCAATFSEEKGLKAAKNDYDGTDLKDNEAARVFWTEVSKNIVFTNSSDEVMEALGNGSADFGILVSSKLRFKGIGYNMEPVYRLNPFAGCRTSYAVMLARNSKNVNTAKLFIRFILGEAEGEGEGYKPFITPGTWSARDDVADVNSVPLSDIDLIIPDTQAIESKREALEVFWEDIIKNSTTEQ